MTSIRSSFVFEIRNDIHIFFSHQVQFLSTQEWIILCCKCLHALSRVRFLSLSQRKATKTLLHFLTWCFASDHKLSLPKLEEYRSPFMKWLALIKILQYFTLNKIVRTKGIYGRILNPLMAVRSRQRAGNCETALLLNDPPEPNWWSGVE